LQPTCKNRFHTSKTQNESLRSLPSCCKLGVANRSMNTLHQQPCAYCGQLFFPQAPNQLYHNDLCSQAAYRQRRKVRRGKLIPSGADYFKAFFAAVLQDVTPSTAQAIWKGCRDHPGRRYAILSWADIPNTTVPWNISIAPESHEGLSYYNVQLDTNVPPNYSEQSSSLDNVLNPKEEEDILTQTKNLTPEEKAAILAQLNAIL
jgi:hypothetical protein